MYFSSHLSDKQYFLSQKIDKNVVYLATTEDRSGLTRQELQCVVTRNETLSGYRNCILYLHILQSWYLLLGYKINLKMDIRIYIYTCFEIGFVSKNLTNVYDS